MFDDFLEASQNLYQSKEPFAIALVVRREIPSSGKPGDKAVIQKDGKIIGWIGGGCTRGIILKEAADALKDGNPRLVRISPDGKVEPEPGIIDYKMTCHSGGSVEVYIEPVLPKPELIIMGKSQVAMALCKLGKAMEYPVTIFARNTESLLFPDADNIFETELSKSQIGRNSCIIVCTQGENDEEALEQAVKSGATYISFVASRKKGSAVFHNLRQRGINFDQLKSIKTPAGIDINAKLPQEVAVSILAEIVTFIRSEDVKDSTEINGNNNDSSNVFINPVCNIPVEKSTAKHVIDYEGESYYFCCDGCKISFEKEPAKYAALVK
jgi:xanthine dehydrogenase accessory factor